MIFILLYNDFFFYITNFFFYMMTMSFQSTSFLIPHSAPFAVAEGQNGLCYHIWSNACCRSSMMSSICSTPMLRRIVDGVMCCCANSSGDICE